MPVETQHHSLAAIAQELVLGAFHPEMLRAQKELVGAADFVIAGITSKKWTLPYEIIPIGDFDTRGSLTEDLFHDRNPFRYAETRSGPFLVQPSGLTDVVISRLRRKGSYPLCYLTWQEQYAGEKYDRERYIGAYDERTIERVRIDMGADGLAKVGLVNKIGIDVNGYEVPQYMTGFGRLDILRRMTSRLLTNAERIKNYSGADAFKGILS